MWFRIYRFLLIIVLAGILYFQFDAWKGRREEKKIADQGAAVVNQIVTGKQNTRLEINTYPQNSVDSLQGMVQNFNQRTQ